jgi:hypothetical protein
MTQNQPRITVDADPTALIPEGRYLTWPMITAVVLGPLSLLGGIAACGGSLPGFVVAWTLNPLTWAALYGYFHMGRLECPHCRRSYADASVRNAPVATTLRCPGCDNSFAKPSAHGGALRPDARRQPMRQPSGRSRDTGPTVSEPQQEPSTADRNRGTASDGPGQKAPEPPRRSEATGAEGRPPKKVKKTPSPAELKRLAELRARQQRVLLIGGASIIACGAVLYAATTFIGHRIATGRQRVEELTKDVRRTEAQLFTAKGELAESRRLLASLPEEKRRLESSLEAYAVDAEQKEQLAVVQQKIFRDSVDRYMPNGRIVPGVDGMSSEAILAKIVGQRDKLMELRQLATDLRLKQRQIEAALKDVLAELEIQGKRGPVANERVQEASLLLSKKQRTLKTARESLRTWEQFSWSSQSPTTRKSAP